MRAAADQDLFLHLEIKVHDQEVQRVIDASLDAFESLGVVSVQLDIDYLDCQTIESAVERGFKVCAYTVNSTKQLASLPLDLIDSVFTDDPLRLVDELKALKNVK
ncbi:hypothetical protein OA249_01650 [Litorivicinus sp.]|nr:hypothetical protein [Litorivicinus sp.]